MPITVSHNLSATTPDNPDYEIQVQHWNSVHAATINAAGSEISGAFGNGGGVSFGLSADGKVTASAPAGAALVNFSAGAASADLGSVVFSNSNGVSFGLNASTITGTVRTNYAGSVGAITGGSITVNTDGVSVNLPAYLTTARGSTDAVGLNTAQTNVTWSVNSSGISINAGGYAGTGFTSTTTAGTEVEATNNTAGLSMAVPAFITTAALSNHSHGDPTLALTNLTGTTASNSAGLTISLSAAAPGAGGAVNFSAGTTSNDLSNVVFSNSHGHSFGLDGSTITVSGIRFTNHFFPYDQEQWVPGQIGNGTEHYQPMKVPNVVFDRIVFPIFFTAASNSTGTVTLSFAFQLMKSTDNAGNIEFQSFKSYSSTLTFNYSGTANSSAMHGARLVSFGATDTVTEGQYWVQIWSRTSTSSHNCTVSNMLMSQLNSNFSGYLGVGSSGQNQVISGLGIAAASTAAFRTSIGTAFINGTGSLALRRPMFYLHNGSLAIG